MASDLSDLVCSVPFMLLVLALLSLFSSMRARFFTLCPDPSLPASPLVDELLLLLALIFVFVPATRSAFDVDDDDVVVALVMVLMFVLMVASNLRLVEDAEDDGLEAVETEAETETDEEDAEHGVDDIPAPL